MVAKKKAILAEDLSEQTKQLFDILNGESDLAVVLIGTSFLDACLASILTNMLVESEVTQKLLGHTGAVGTFSARTDLCYALGTIPKVFYQDLSILGRVRNIVAHNHLERNFDSPEIVEQCAGLRWVSYHLPERTPVAARSTFITTAGLMSNSLILKSLQLQQVRKDGKGLKSPTNPTAQLLKFIPAVME